MAQSECGNCIETGSRYCNNQGLTANTDFRSLAGESVKSSNLASCCSDASECYEDKMRSGTTLCSFPYNNTVYAKYTCPFDNDCGATSYFEIAKLGDKLSIVSKPPKYTTCFYKILAKCGIPAITSTGLPTSNKYEFIEFKADHLYLGEYSS